MCRIKFCFYLAFILSICACTKEANPELVDILYSSNPNFVWESEGVTAPDSGCVKLRTRPIGGSLMSVLNDKNELHIAHASAGGIEPIEDMQTAWQNSCGLVAIHSNRLYYVEELRHSYPYLTRQAADLLNEICSRFRDSLDARGGGSYRPKVTSLTRTESSVSRLRRVNRNSTNHSAHIYGTTFDLSYNKFICDDTTHTLRTFEDLKNLLGEIVATMRSEGRLVAKCERRQACFHITVCSPDINERP